MKFSQRRLRFTIAVLTILTCSIPALAQVGDDDLPSPGAQWLWNGSASVTVSHISFSNWTAGGDYSYMLGFNSSVSPQWSDSVWSFLGSFEGNFSVFKSKYRPHQKTNDDLELNLKVGRRLSGNLHAVLFADLKTQFWPGYEEYISTTHYISNVMAPGYLTNGIGLDYRLDDENFSVVFSPFSSKQNIVLDRGVDPTQYGVSAGRKVFIEPGAYARILYSTQVLPNTTLTTKTILFSDYSEKPNIDVSFNGKVEYTIISILKLYAKLELLEDKDVNVNVYEDLDNDGTSDDFVGRSPKTQLKGEFGLALSVTF